MPRGQPYFTNAPSPIARMDMQAATAPGRYLAQGIMQAADAIGTGIEKYQAKQKESERRDAAYKLFEENSHILEQQGIQVPSDPKERRKMVDAIGAEPILKLGDYARQIEQHRATQRQMALQGDAMARKADTERAEGWVMGNLDSPVHPGTPDDEEATKKWQAAGAADRYRMAGGADSRTMEELGRAERASQEDRGGYDTIEAAEKAAGGRKGQVYQKGGRFYVNNLEINAAADGASPQSGIKQWQEARAALSTQAQLAKFLDEPAGQLAMSAREYAQAKAAGGPGFTPDPALEERLAIADRIQRQISGIGGGAAPQPPPQEIVQLDTEEFATLPDGRRVHVSELPPDTRIRDASGRTGRTAMFRPIQLNWPAGHPLATPAQ